MLLHKKPITIVLILIFTSLALLAPLQAAKSSFDWWYFIDNFIIRPLMRKIVNAIENRLLNRVGEIVTDKANGSKDPHWITNWRNHLLESNARGVDVFRSVLADTDLCPHFGDSLKQTFGAEDFGGLIDGSGNLTFAPGTAPFQVSSRCTLSSDVDVDAFREDFTQGGWDAWMELIQPQNNFFGAFSGAIAEQNEQTAIESKASENQSIAQKGFLGNKLDAFIGGTHASGCVRKGTENRCTFFGREVTPGTIFDQATERRLNQKFETIGGAAEIQDVILALSDAVVTKISNQLDNLLGLDITGAPIDGGFFTERSYQAELDAAASTRDAAREEGVSELTCQQRCQTTIFPQCQDLQGSEAVQCNQAATAVCLSRC